MVGVPGRSKGCNTCRRRKVKCDEGRPACQKCLNSQRACEGYERYPVFINRSESGLHKRQHMEEARPLSPIKQPSPEASTALLKRMDTGFMEMHAYIGHFASSLMPNAPFRPTSWAIASTYHQAFQHPSPPELMRSVIQALVETRFGRHANNDDLYRHGRQVYGRALGLLQQAIEDPKQSQVDETLVAVRLMIAYESYEATTANSTAWHNHISGLAMLFQNRRPELNSSNLSQLVMFDLRCPLMIQALMLRRKPRGTHLPIEHTVLSPEFSTPVFEITSFGFEIAGLLEEGDRIATLAGSTTTTQILYHHLEALLKMRQQGADLLERFRISQGTNVACEVCKGIPISCTNPYGKGSGTLFRLMGSCEFYLLTSMVCGLLATVSTTIPTIYGKVQHHPGFTQEMADQCQQWGTSSYQKDLGTQILDLAMHCMHEELGLLYSRSLVFPLQCARWVLMGDVAKTASCLAMIEVLSGKRHIIFAKQVNQGQEHIPFFARKAITAC